MSFDYNMIRYNWGKGLIGVGTGHTSVYCCPLFGPINHTIDVTNNLSYKQLKQLQKKSYTFHAKAIITNLRFKLITYFTFDKANI